MKEGSSLVKVGYLSFYVNPHDKQCHYKPNLSPFPFVLGLRKHLCGLC